MEFTTIFLGFAVGILLGRALGDKVGMSTDYIEVEIARVRSEYQHEVLKTAVALLQDCEEWGAVQARDNLKQVCEAYEGVDEV